MADDGPIITDKTEKVKGNRVTIEPITRLEGHGKIDTALVSFHLRQLILSTQ